MYCLKGRAATPPEWDQRVRIERGEEKQGVWGVGVWEPTQTVE